MLPCLPNPPWVPVQENYFFDGDANQLKAAHTVLRFSCAENFFFDGDATQLKAVHTACVSPAQENYFFDGDANQLEATHTVLRLRFYNGNDKATVTIK
eukprot:scaffold181856_cov23-Tisochrysis_lutea.AAC.1